MLCKKVNLQKLSQRNCNGVHRGFGAKANLRDDIWWTEVDAGYVKRENASVFPTEPGILQQLKLFFQLTKRRVPTPSIKLHSPAIDYSGKSPVYQRQTWQRNRSRSFQPCKGRAKTRRKEESSTIAKRQICLYSWVFW